METVGMILCGGLGKRLRPVTETVPKPLIEIKDDYTILDKQLFDFKNAGVDEVYLLTGFLHDKIKERYGDEYNGVKIHYVIEDEPLGTLNAIRLGMEAINGDKQCIIRNGDIVSDVNIKAMIEYGVKSSLPVIMFVTQMQSPYGIVEMNGDRLVSFKEKPILEDYYINGGIYFTKSKIDFGEFKTGDIEKIYFPTIAKENNLGYFKENGIYWIAVDTYKELEAVKKEYFSKNDSIRIQPGVVHSIVATENTLLHEVSTPYLEDTVCIEDYYVR